MSGKSLVVAGLLAVGVMLMADNSASAQYVVRHGNHFHTVSPGYGYGGGYGGGYYARPVYTVPVYTAPVAVYPTVVGGYPWGNFGSPLLPSYGYNRGVYGGYPVYGGSYNTLNFGIQRPGFSLNLGFIR